MGSRVEARADAEPKIPDRAFSKRSLTGPRGARQQVFVIGMLTVNHYGFLVLKTGLLKNPDCGIGVFFYVRTNHDVDL